MFIQPAAAHAARLFPSRSGRRPVTVLLLGGLLFLRCPHVSAQTMISGAQIRNPFTPVSVLPTTCKPYSTYFLTTSNTPYICTATNTFTPIAGVAQGGQ